MPDGGGKRKAVGSRSSAWRQRKARLAGVCGCDYHQAVAGNCTCRYHRIPSSCCEYHSSADSSSVSEMMGPMLYEGVVANF